VLDVELVLSAVVLLRLDVEVSLAAARVVSSLAQSLSMMESRKTESVPTVEAWVLAVVLIRRIGLALMDTLARRDAARRLRQAVWEADILVVICVYIRDQMVVTSEG
jgi:hypothetical protein